MNTQRRLTVGLWALAFLATAVAHASDRVSVYAKVDRVVLAPSAEAPETIQIFGVFSVAQPNDPNDYRAAARGYLYYTVGTNRDAARREWADLKSIAGTGQVVAFGSRWEGTPRVRDTSETPSTPDVYAVNTGVTKVNGRTDYEPVRALIDFKR